MSPARPESSITAPVTVRYWAAARAAAGVDSDSVDVGDGTTLAVLLKTVHDLHPDRPRLADVVGVCSVLVGDRPVGATDPDDVAIAPGDTVELLPPFAGGST
ncbi:MAG TPA: MoaD/ThiS family protein [Nocardioides sp.]|uniref:MoaD/ThiS family protein n=1 Tax=Nocardioides sp. TaxID=35761 RepID=UPI002D7F017A|nr:MoaD/ThiS family protein [Nocardioides sp.]HET6653160.1 MoaD/ThiS family protein [Nocardioides sp.]